MKTLIRAVAVFALLPVLCVMVALIWITANRLTAESVIAQQLTALDQQLAVPRGQIPEGITVDGFMPMQLGSFQRETWFNRYICSGDTGFPQPCFSTNYRIDPNDYRLQVWVTILKKSNNPASTLNDIFSPVNCGDMIAKKALRTGTQVSLYGSCPPGLFAPPELSYVAWENGNWFIKIVGRYDMMSQFIAAYPY